MTPLPKLNGCEHTTDPNGWVMNEQGDITGKCPCWAPPITPLAGPRVPHWTDDRDDEDEDN